jgi:hypothetical protein
MLVFASNGSLDQINPLFVRLLWHVLHFAVAYVFSNSVPGTLEQWLQPFGGVVVVRVAIGFLGYPQLAFFSNQPLVCEQMWCCQCHQALVIGSKSRSTDTGRCGPLFHMLWCQDACHLLIGN